MLDRKGGLQKAGLKEIDPDSFEIFCTHLDALTPKEREIFELYLQGRNGPEILEIQRINANTLKYHNKHIYSKLGVNSHKQLLMYVSLIRQEASEQGSGDEA